VGADNELDRTFCEEASRPDIMKDVAASLVAAEENASPKAGPKEFSAQPARPHWPP
jgi:hypothetical protein